MFCWGNATHHELCLEGPEAAIDLVIKPTLSKWRESNRMKAVAAGEFHTMYLTNTGHLFSCGSNEVGQLGRHTDKREGKTPDYRTKGRWTARNTESAASKVNTNSKANTSIQSRVSTSRTAASLSHR